MKSAGIRSLLFFAAFACNLFGATAAWSGGELGEARDHHQDGLAIFGFVKDSSGRAVRDAKVTANIKGLGSVVTQSDAAGVYKFPGFGKNVKQDQISVSCAKDGYKQTKTMTRMPPGKAQVVAIEIECSMQPMR
jgi:hypothetical protein